MSSNIDIITADISISEDLTIFVMSFWKKWKNNFFKLEMTWFYDIIPYAVTPLSDLAAKIFAMLSTQK